MHEAAGPDRRTEGTTMKEHFVQPETRWTHCRDCAGTGNADGSGDQVSIETEFHGKRLAVKRKCPHCGGEL